MIAHQCYINDCTIDEHTLTSVQLCIFTFFYLLATSTLVKQTNPSNIWAYSCTIALSPPLEAKSWHQTLPVHPSYSIFVTARDETSKKCAVSRLTCVSYSSLHRATQNHRSGKYVWKHLCVLFELFHKSLHSPEHNKCITKLISPFSLWLHKFSFKTLEGLKLYKKNLNSTKKK